MKAVRNGATAGVCLSLVTLFGAQGTRADDATLLQADDPYYKQADQALNKSSASEKHQPGQERNPVRRRRNGILHRHGDPYL